MPEYNEQGVEPGNIAPGYNYGVGISYQYLLSLNGIPQSMGVHVYTDYFPKKYTRIGAGLNFRLLAFGNDKISVGGLSGFSFNFIFNPTFQQMEMGSSFDLLSLQYKGFEFVWSLQGNDNRWFPDKKIDNTSSIFRLSYRFYSK